jgi:hypothetical protein
MAPSLATAERAGNLIHSAMLLLEGSNFFSRLVPGGNFAVYPSDDYEDLYAFLKDQYVSTLHIPLACLIAAKASLRHRLVYALAKLRLSYEIFSAPGMALNPSGGPNISKSHLPEEHVRLAYAIVLANACIEELGLRVPSHPGKQSWINGDWNPEVRQELEQTLCLQESTSTNLSIGVFAAGRRGSRRSARHGSQKKRRGAATMFATGRCK